MQTTFSSSRLVRLLGEWTPLDAPAAGMDVAERLGRWLGPLDAIGLQAAHQAIRTLGTPAPRAPADQRLRGPDTLPQDLQALRAALARAIQRPLDDDDTWSSWAQRHHKLQHDMEQAIAPLRDHVRQAMSRVSAGLRQLAALDAALEPVLAAREQKLLPGVAAQLERRFQQLRRGGDEGWLDTFRNDWRQALLAELDLRLEPVAGLVDALVHDIKKTPA